MKPAPQSLPTLDQIRNYTLGLAALRRSDVWLASFPRAGSTWLRTLLFNTYRLASGDKSSLDLVSMDSIMPSLGARNLLTEWRFKPFPRPVKTHRPYRRFLFGVPARSIYILRDPRDMMVSYFCFQKQRLVEPFRGTFAEFVRDPRLGIVPACRHYASWRRRNHHLVRYEELLTDTERVFREVLDLLGLQIAAESVNEAIRLSSFESMRAAEERTGLKDASRFAEDFRTVRSGRAGGWKSHFSPEDLEFFETARARFELPHYS